MNFICFLLIFVTDQFHQTISEISTASQAMVKTFSAIHNVDIPPGFTYFNAIASQSYCKCASLCLQDEACKGSVFTGDSCHLVSQLVLTSQLQYYSGYMFMSKYKCISKYSGKANNHDQSTFNNLTCLLLPRKTCTFSLSGLLRP